MDDVSAKILRWLWRTPVQTFILCPLIVIACELVLHRGRLTIVPWGLPLLAWGYLQYLLVGRFRLPLAGGTPGMEVPPRAHHRRRTLPLYAQPDVSRPPDFPHRAGGDILVRGWR